MKARYGLRSSSYSLHTRGLALALAWAVVACKPAVEDRYALSADKADKLEVYTSELHVTSVADKMLLVIPTHGCVPCIDEALKYTAATRDTARLTILLSGTNKRLKTLTAHKYHIDPAKMLYDADNRAAHYGLMDIYPVLFWQGAHGGVSAVHLHAGDIYKELPRLGLEVVGL